LGHFSTLLPYPPFPPSLPQFQAGPILPLSLILLKKRINEQKNKQKQEKKNLTVLQEQKLQILENKVRAVSCEQ
jgi:hypothetical protein